MDESTAQSIFTWLGNHAILAGLFIFFIALVESLAIVGIIVPGVIFMLIIGAYLATGQFSFVIAVLLAFAGAVAGDSISYYLGFRYKDKLINLWPISRYPESFNKGIVFFERHGSKSIILGRFIGPLRPLIPAIAGMFQMSKTQFMFSNVLSAMVWAPIILLPGYIIGLSIEFASDIAGRLILLLLIVAIILWVIFRLIKFTYLSLLPWFDTAVVLLLNWSHKHPLTGTVPSILFEKKYSTINVFTVLLFLFILLTGLLFVLPDYLTLLSDATNFDIFLNSLYLSFTSPVSNQLMINLLNLIDLNWILFLAIITSIIILVKKHYRLFQYFLFNIVLLGLLQISITHYFNIDINNNLVALSCYLFLTFILTINASARRKIVYYGVCYTLISAVLFTQIYFTNTRILPILFTSLFAILWVIILTTAYRHHPDIKKFTERFQRNTALVIISIITINLVFNSNSVPLKSITAAIILVEKKIWQDHLWQVLPSHRKGFINKTKQPFNIQWFASQQEISNSLINGSNSVKPKWQLSHAPTVSELLQILNPQARINALAIYPHLHNGAYEHLRFIQYSNKQDQFFVIRLWKTQYKIQHYNPTPRIKPLWQGTVTKLILIKRAGVKLLQTSLLSESEFNHFLENLDPGKNERILKINKNNKSGVMLLSVK